MKRRAKPPKLRQCGWCYRTALYRMTGSKPGGFRVPGVIACGPPIRETLYACEGHRDRAWNLIRKMARYSTRKLPDQNTLF